MTISHRLPLPTPVSLSALAPSSHLSSTAGSRSATRGDTGEEATTVEEERERTVPGGVEPTEDINRRVEVSSDDDCVEELQSGPLTTAASTFKNLVPGNR